MTIAALKEVLQDRLEAIEQQMYGPDADASHLEGRLEELRVCLCFIELDSTFGGADVLS